MVGAFVSAVVLNRIFGDAISGFETKEGKKGQASLFGGSVDNHVRSIGRKPLTVGFADTATTARNHRSLPVQSHLFAPLIDFLTSSKLWPDPIFRDGVIRSLNETMAFCCDNPFWCEPFSLRLASVAQN
jgi:hypothetical protein